MKKIPFLLLEILTIVCILTILVFFGIHKYNKLFNDFPKYTVKFNDIDGLSIGSPVRFAGYHVGHIVKQEFKDDKIFVTFKITEKNVEIPEGSRADIEFTGLVGSKSLEIKPPLFKKGAQVYVNDPLRVNSIMETVNVLSESTLDFSKGLYSFLNKNEESAGLTLKEASKELKSKSSILENSKGKIKETGIKAVQDTKKINQLVKGISDNIDFVRETVGEITTSDELDKLKANIDKIKESTENISKIIEEGKSNQKIKELNEKMANLDIQVEQLNEKINKIKKREVGYINEFNDSIRTTTDKLQKFIDSREEKKELDKPDLSS